MEGSAKAPSEKVGYLGPEGSYSSVAAKMLCPDSECVPYHSFSAAVGALLRGDAAFAVLPVENTLQGAVTQNLDLLYANPGLYAVREYLLPVEHRLIVREGTGLSDIRTVYSHQQAILQCGKFLSEKLPEANVVYTDSTVQSLAHVQSKSDAGIVGSHVSRQGFCFLGGNIADEQKNYTHFLLVAKGEENLPEHSRRVYFAATCPHEPGSLLKMLQILSVYDLNMTKIESRPIKNSPGEYCFFIELEGDRAENHVRAALDRLAEYSKNFKLLGCY